MFNISNIAATLFQHTHILSMKHFSSLWVDMLVQTNLGSLKNVTSK